MTHHSSQLIFLLHVLEGELALAPLVDPARLPKGQRVPERDDAARVLACWRAPASSVLGSRPADSRRRWVASPEPAALSDPGTFRPA
ncbi:hypothetical protein QJS66_14805 [Kocuria rhizophila]|nr:hypothetical protein QJS66_14805 [Kocuria rhizophila]